MTAEFVVGLLVWVFVIIPVGVGVLIGVLSFLGNLFGGKR